MPMTLRPIVLKNAKGKIDKIRIKSLEVFVDKLKEREGDNLLKVVLFGSVARGDSQPDSDVDVFVLMKDGTNEELVECTTDIAVDVQLEEGECKVHISPFTSALKEYLEYKSFGIPVYHIIDDEGVVLYDIEG